jgi:hypothetical protein
MLSFRSTASDDERTRSIVNKLRKRVARGDPAFLGSDDGLAWLARQVLHLSRIVAAEPREQPYSAFRREAEKETEAYNRAQTGIRLELDEKLLRERLADLIEDNVLLAGVLTQCRSCGSRRWTQIDETRQRLDCSGCGATYPLRPELPWHYRLNSLVQAATVHHGLIPVVLVLARLLVGARTSFFFAPSLDIFEGDPTVHVGDVDIVCVQDGKLVVGEVKESVDLFDSDAFRSMEIIGRRVRPDQIIFSALDEAPSSFVRSQLSLLRESLAPYRVGVEWFRLPPHVFDASAADFGLRREE